jgi:hypothetical protein
MSSTPNAPKFQAFQFEFARHIRDPKTHARPAGVPARRMKIYNELLYNNLEGFLLACFPVLHRVLGARKWAKLVREFFAEHRCHTPFFRQIPDEFVQYLQTERGVRPGDPPFMVELAHYEWIELVLSVSTKEAPLESIDATGDLASGRPALNPVLALLQYQYPVQRIGPGYKPRAAPAETTYLLVFRNADFAVNFVALNPVAAHLVALLQTNKTNSGEKLLKKIARELKHPTPRVAIQGGLEILRELRSAGAILGTWHQ